MRHAVQKRMHPHYRESNRSKGHVVFAKSNYKSWLVYVESLGPLGKLGIQIKLTLM
jgi:hypothetical protein